MDRTDAYYIHPNFSDNRDPIPPGETARRPSLPLTAPVEQQIGRTLPGNSQQRPSRVHWKVGGQPCLTLKWGLLGSAVSPPVPPG